MAETSKRIRKAPKKDKQKAAIDPRLIAVIILSCVVLLLLAGNIFLDEGQQQAPDTVPEEPEKVTESVDAPEEESVPLPEQPEETEPVERTILPELAEYYEQNPDMAGWIKIEDTVVDYPFMYTPEDPQKYLRIDFDGNFSTAGTLFLDGNCSLDPESDNLILHGHNMRNGSMFKTLLSYKDEAFWQEHPSIELSTLYEKREYEVLAVFYDRVYYTDETCFKYYQFIDAEDEADYNEAIAYYKDNVLYDTGVTAEFGDRLLTLTTCSYHVANGRFVVVAKEVTED